METIGTKITQLRKQKALSQESLAELSKVNVRTIQRIENNETTPRGATLKLLCDALEISPEEIINFEKTEDNSVIIWLHISVMLGVVLPLGNIILPLILWLTNKNRIENVDKQGKNILNFQILFSVTSFLLIFLGAFGKILHLDLPIAFQKLIPIVLFLYIFNLFYPIVNAIRISKGTIKNFYPNIIRFIK